MRFPWAKGAVAGVVIAVFSVVSPGKTHAASTLCSSFPDVSWWNGLNHDMVRRIVAIRYGGDWNRYIERWNKQAAALKSISESGRSAVIKRSALTLSGDALESYLGQVEERLAVTRCLAKEAEEMEVASLADFATAAGGEEPEAIVTELLIDDDAEGGKIDIEIKAYCESGLSVFRVWNKGKRWPKTAMVGAYKILDNTALSTRRIRLAIGQKMTFKVKNDANNSKGVALWVDPSWTDRPFGYDAELNCN